MGVYEKQVVVVTGCSAGGIGHALARGSQVLPARPGRLVRRECASRLSTVLGEFGRIDIVVNNAGVQCVGPLAELPLSAVEQTFNTNVYVYMGLRLIQLVVPHMASGKKGKRQRWKVTALAPVPGQVLYSSNIHVLVSDTLSVEQKPFGRSNSKEQPLSQAQESTPSEEFAKKTVDEVLKINHMLALLRPSIYSNGNIVPYAPFHSRFPYKEEISLLTLIDFLFMLVAVPALELGAENQQVQVAVEITV
ncbi:UNVERIFIED_CONTAM: hypothetical protein Scaly_0009400 [Sesamum calycinum]|uniref:Uncharacterized protein n=1 Tax=Sesamum calycinum TaxID=2727403 RepID=A0AAW2STV9_9LAMI